MSGKIVTTPEQIQYYIKQIEPTNIAVAFIGAGWESYISNPNKISSIVLSPTLGSNPKAIEELASLITWEKVHFLDNLHAKIYIGKNSALMGSCNLSDNGMGEGGLEEAAIYLQDSHQLEILQKEVESYVRKAKLAYPTTKSKQDRVRELIEQRKKMPGYCPPGEYGQAPHIKNYSFSEAHRIHIVYYEYEVEKISKNEEIIRANLDVPFSININDLFYDEMEFRNEDDIKKGDWLLSWKSSEPKKNLPTHAGKVSWIYINAVINDGCVDEQYKKWAGQLVKSIPRPPFQLDRKTKKIICDVLSQPDFKKLRPNVNSEPWDCNQADEIVPKFIETVKRYSGT